MSQTLNEHLEDDQGMLNQMVPPLRKEGLKLHHSSKVFYLTLRCCNI